MLVQAVGHHGDKSALRLDHATQINLPNLQTLFPVEQPEPDGSCTTGLKKGSRFPLIAHFFSSGLGALAASPLLPATAVWASGAILVGATVGLPWSL